VAHIDSFRELEVWQVSMDLVVECYRLTAGYPPEERFALSRDTHRSAVSIPSNVAEGHNRHALRAYLNHVNIALGSAAELETQIEIALRLGYLTASDVRAVSAKVKRVGQMLRRLQQSLEGRGARTTVVLGLLCVIAAVLWLS
jgi:four helix bundle protein